jgi:cullin 1
MWGFFFVADLSINETNQQKSSILMYQEAFEVPFLRSTLEFYQEMIRQFLLQNSIVEYLELIEVRLEEEQRRVKSYLHNSTRSKVK